MKMSVLACTLLIGVLLSTTAFAQDPGRVDIPTLASRLRAGLAEIKAAYENARVIGTLTVTDFQESRETKRQRVLDLLQQGKNLKLISTVNMGKRSGVEHLFVWTPQLGFTAVRQSHDQTGYSVKNL